MLIIFYTVVMFISINAFAFGVLYVATQKGN